MTLIRISFGVFKMCDYERRTNSPIPFMREMLRTLRSITFYVRLLFSKEGLLLLVYETPAN